MVLDQLRCSGVIEAVRVMLEAYPTRIDYEDSESPSPALE